MTPNPNRLLAAGKIRHHHRGFALVISLSLMVLLTVLAVGLLSLSTISLRSSSRGDAMAEARSNARLALMFAIGELQQLAGPDQRVTATADLAGTAAGEAIAAGAAPLNNNTFSNAQKGLSAVQAGTRHWTGVWRNTNLTTPGVEIYTKTPAPTHLQWLVSGNETSAKPTFTPASQALQVGQDGTLANPSSAVVLVGPGTVGTGSTSLADNCVSAPLVEMAGTQGRSAGRYAWWIGDEGVKAKFNRTPDDTTNTATYATLANQRSGWEVVGGLEAYPTPAQPNQQAIDKVVTLGQAELLDPSLEPGKATPRSLFHSATTEGFGVLADNLQGGLRVDLTAVLEKGLPSTAQTTFPNSPTTTGNIVPTTLSAARLLKGPKWGRLAAFNNQARAITSSKKLTVAGSTDASALTIAPVIMDLRLLMGAKLVKKSESDYEVHPCGKIAVVLANPYPFPLEWSSNLELLMVDDTPTTNSISSRVYDSAGSAGFFSNRGAPAVFNNATFVISKDELAPGEAKAFTMGGQVLRRQGNTAAIKVDLKPFSSSSPSNFENCIVQEETAVNNSTKLLDVRESWTTTQVSAELRLAGARSGTLLRRLERFELDNGFHAETKRSVSAAIAGTMTKPFPLNCYCFQISQPGMDYGSLLPSSDLLGTRASTLRTFTDFNLQAIRYTKPITSYNPPPFFMESANSLGTLPFAPPGGDTGSAFTRNLASSPLAWGRSSVGNVKKTVLFTFPDQLVSLAQLQHVDLTADDSYVGIAHQPGNAVGNSYATPFVKRNLTIQKRDNYVITGQGGGESQTSTKTSASFYDMSYLLNAALWDSYFFSTCDSSGAPLNHNLVVAKPPANSGDLLDPVKASGHLLVNGAFNVNSTNKDAWKALLAGNRFLKHPADGDGTNTDALYPRSLEQPSAGKSAPSGTGDDSFSGYRRLSNDQIDKVAEEIVKQVRVRGPFLSLSHFVNRALTDFTTRNRTNIPYSYSGALQSALDNSGANISPNGSKSAFPSSLTPARDKSLMKPGPGTTPKADMWGTPVQPNGSRGSLYGGITEDRYEVWAGESKDLNPGSVASIYADRLAITDSNLQYEQGYRSTGIPGWLTQADVLQAIGPVIAARSDTFRIRCYGEALGEDGKSVAARAWCEAVVQRQPDYVDASNLPSDRAANATATNLSPINRIFGRKFVVASFRWLSKNEI